MVITLGEGSGDLLIGRSVDLKNSAGAKAKKQSGDLFIG
jgi:hypothetical protein